MRRFTVNAKRGVATTPVQHFQFVTRLNHRAGLLARICSLISSLNRGNLRRKWREAAWDVTRKLIVLHRLTFEDDRVVRHVKMGKMGSLEPLTGIEKN